MSDGTEDTRIRTEDPSPPVLAGRFELIGRLGEGGMGAVFLARRLDSAGELVAIKRLTLASARDRFENEARVLLNLKSPHTVRVLELGRDEEGTPFVVMEYLEGRTLGDAIEAGDLSDSAVLAILRDVCASLEEAHGLGLVHRDLKPANIFLQRVAQREHVRVLDFGIAKLLAPDAALAVPLQPNAAPTMGAIGSPPFMAPEQCRGEPVSDRTDLFALGLVAHHALAGRPAYDYPSGEPNAILFTHASDDPRPLTHDRSGHPVDPAVAALVDGLLARDPEARLGPAGVVRARIESILARGSPPEVGANPRRVPHRRWLRRWAPGWVPGLVAATVIGGMASWRLREAGPTTQRLETIPAAPGPAEAEPVSAAPTAGRSEAPAAAPDGSGELDRTAARARRSVRLRGRARARLLGCESLSGPSSPGDVQMSLRPAIEATLACLRRTPAGRPVEVRYRWRGEQAFFHVVGEARDAPIQRCLDRAEGRITAPRGLMARGPMGMVFASCRFGPR